MTDVSVTATANMATADAGCGYMHRVRDETIGRTIASAEVDPALDADRLHVWLGSDHAKPYWQLDLPKPVFRVKLDERLADNHLTPCVGLPDHTPMSYWEVYRTADSMVTICYDAAPEDRGVHLLIGPPEYLGHGHSVPLLWAMTAFQFRATGITRVVSEPDMRNEWVVHAFKRRGYESQGRIDLPDKEALLMHCERNRLFDTVTESAKMEVGRQASPASAT